MIYFFGSMGWTGNAAYVGSASGPIVNYSEHNPLVLINAQHKTEVNMMGIVLVCSAASPSLCVQVNVWHLLPLSISFIPHCIQMVT